MLQLLWPLHDDLVRDIAIYDASGSQDWNTARKCMDKRAPEATMRDPSLDYNWNREMVSDVLAERMVVRLRD